MKILLPENISDITLHQFQRYEKLNKRLEEEDITAEEYNKRKIVMFSGISYHQIDRVSHKDLEAVMVQIDEALNKDDEFIQRFDFKGVEYGFIPNFDTITTAEFVDLSKYGVEPETLHYLMAILFRPIVKDSIGSYDIATYKGTAETFELMKELPMNVVNGAIVFFCNLSTELQSYIQKFTAEQELKKDKERQTTLENGDGMPLSTT